MKKKLFIIGLLVLLLPLIGCSEIATQIPGTYFYNQKKAEEEADKQKVEARQRQWQYEQSAEYKEKIRQEKEWQRQKDVQKKQEEERVAYLQKQEKERVSNLPEPVVNGWTYLGIKSDIFTYKKIGSTNEFMLIYKAYRDDPPIYIKMDSNYSFKKNVDGKFWKCETGLRWEDSFDCHFLKNGLNQFDECMHKASRKYNSGTVKKTHSMTRQQHNDWLFKVTTDMCKRNWRSSLNESEEGAVLFAYKSRTYSSPNWDEQDQISKQAEKEEVDKLQRRFEERDQLEQAEILGEAASAKETYMGESQSENTSSNQMEILKHKSGGCNLIITNHTVYEFEIKINGVSYGKIPTRKAAKIQGLNCDGFMVEAWPQGTVTGFVSRAFQHNQKQGKTFNWNLRYKN